MKDKFFLAGDFIDIQYVWILPFLFNYLKYKNINSIITEKNLPNRVIKNKNLKKYINYEFRILDKSFLITKFLSIFFIFKYLPILLKILFIKKNDLLDRKNNFLEMQIFHSFWDMNNLKVNEQTLKVPLISKFKSFLIIILTICKAENLLLNNIKIALVGHNVYSKKTLSAILVHKNVTVISQANFNFHIQNKYLEKTWDWPNKKFYQKHLLNISDHKINGFWNKRLKGLGDYEDSNKALKSEFKIKKNIDYPKNLIMLHIFRDSPFISIDKKRIFCDYFHWIDVTLDIIKNSDEKWVIRPHPSAKRWGEDQSSIIKNIFSKKFGSKIPKNIFFDTRKISNTDLFKRCNKLVTYSGTSHLEVGCFGVKSIIISETSASRIDKFLFHKPKNIANYKKLLLEEKLNIFKLNSSQSNLCKKILYIRENYFSMRREVKGKYIYRGDKENIRDKDYKLSMANFENYEKYLLKLGSIFEKEINHTVSSKFINEYE